MLCYRPDVGLVGLCLYWVGAVLGRLGVCRSASVCVGLRKERDIQHGGSSKIPGLVAMITDEAAMSYLVWLYYVCDQ